MTKDELPSDATPQLQFSTVEPINSGNDVTSISCLTCKRPITDSYYALGDQVLCESCCTKIKEPPKGNGVLRFGKAAIAGTIAGLLGALIWYGIRVAVNLEIGLIAILVGFMVGKTIHRVAGRGGMAYQFVAVALTYSCICANYIPDIVSDLMGSVDAADKADIAMGQNPSGVNPAVDPANNEASVVAEALKELEKEAKADVEQPKPSPVELVIGIFVLAAIVFAIALSAPIMMGMQSPIGLLIIGFALWEAWKFTAYYPLPITGPYQVGAPENLEQA